MPSTSTAKLDVNGLPGGKAAGAAVGAGTGSGAGVVVGAVACIATGPFFPLCVMTVVPAGAAIGAATGAVVGAVRTESAEAMATKTKSLTDQLLASSYQNAIAVRLQERFREDLALDLPLAAERPAVQRVADVSADAVVEPLDLEVGLTEVGTEGKREFALRLVSRLVLRRSSGVVVWQIVKEVQSETELALDGWMANDARALHGVLDLCVREAARRLVVDLGRGVATGRLAPDPAPGKYSTSCEDRPADWPDASRTTTP